MTRGARVRSAVGALLLCATAGCGTAAVPGGPGPAVPAASGTASGTASAPAAPSAGRTPPPAAAARDVSAPEPFVPRYLVLPSGGRAAVERAGTADDGSLTVPDDPSRVGWWTGGARVGDPFGSIVLAGHVDSRRYGVGVLAELTRVRPGQRVTVGAGGRTMTFRVSEVREVPKARLASGTDAFSQTVAPRLVLITCSGPFDPVRRAYEDNLVVVATPVA